MIRVLEGNWWPNYQPSREDTIPADCQHSSCALGASMATQRLTFQPSPAHLLARGAADAAAAAAGVPSAAAGLGAAPLAAERLLAVHRPRGLAALTALVHFLPAHSCAGASVTPAGLATDGKSAQTELPPQGQGAHKVNQAVLRPHQLRSTAPALHQPVSQSADQLPTNQPSSQAGEVHTRLAGAATHRSWQVWTEQGSTLPHVSPHGGTSTSQAAPGSCCLPQGHDFGPASLQGPHAPEWQRTSQRWRPQSSSLPQTRLHCGRGEEGLR